MQKTEGTRSGLIKLKEAKTHNGRPTRLHSAINTGAPMTMKNNHNRNRNPPSIFSTSGQPHKSAMSVFSFGEYSCDINNTKKYRRRPMINRIEMVGDISIIMSK